MKKGFAAFISGVGVSLLAAYAARGIRRQRKEQGLDQVPDQVSDHFQGKQIDLNQCSMSDFRKLGLDEHTAERICENRPYRTKLELVSRLMLPSDVYGTIKDRVEVFNPDEPVKVAS